MTTETGNRKNARTAGILLGVVVTMAGLSLASSELYDWFCRVTGFGGVTQVAEGESDIVLDQEITVHFDASIEQGMGWSFKPETRSVTLRIGETGLVYYRATNITDKPVAGQAAFNVTPFSAGAYFDKIQCFCFTEQVLMPGESVLMPVTFYVDPEIVEDREARYVDDIVLSYQFFEIELPEHYAEQAAARAAAEDANVN